MSDQTATGGGAPGQVPQKRLTRWLLGAACFGTFALGFVVLQPHWLPSLSSAAPAETEAVAPPPVAKVKALGEVLPASDLVTVAGPSGADQGRIARILIADGDQVDEGQTLAVLDTEADLKSKLAQAVATESQKRLSLEAKTADLDATERQLSAQIDQLSVALQKAQLELDQKTRLRDSGMYEDAALVDLRLNVQSSAYNLRNTQSQLDRNRVRTPDGHRLDEAIAAADLASATAARATAEASYNDAFIHAPIAGRILDLKGRVGEAIGSEGFAVLGDTSAMTVRAEVYESDIGQVFVGQKVKATSRAVNGSLEGEVTRLGVRITDQTILSTDPAAIVDARVVEVWIRLDAASSLMTADRSGLQVVVEFQPKDN